MLLLLFLLLFNNNNNKNILIIVIIIIILLLGVYRDLGDPVVRPLAARTEGPGFDSPIAQHVQRFFLGPLRMARLVHWY